MAGLWPRATRQGAGRVPSPAAPLRTRAYRFATGFGPVRQGLVWRIASAAVLGPLTVALVWLGGWWTFGLAICLFAVAAGEFVGLVHAGSPWWRRAWPALPLLLLGLAVVDDATPGYRTGLILGGSAIALFGFALELVRSMSTDALRGFSAAGGSVLYLAPAMLCGLMIADADDGSLLLLFLAASVFSFDSFAFAVGRAIGRHRLAPAVSPGKTWEGLAGGTAGALAAGALFSIWLDVPAPWLALLAGAVGLAGQAGDLLESAVKRAVGAKDSSRLIPGHGGVLDRIDSFTTALPAGLALLLLVGLI
ncbi:MAG: phosphatidate cytidylyltransferase [Chloroflexota bacterium]|nr:phosphatidate cytidylyltransferase [Chloroflexota bacterium]